MNDATKSAYECPPMWCRQALDDLKTTDARVGAKVFQREEVLSWHLESRQRRRVACTDSDCMTAGGMVGADGLHCGVCE